MKNHGAKQFLAERFAELRARNCFVYALLPEDDACDMVWAVGAIKRRRTQEKEGCQNFASYTTCLKRSAPASTPKTELVFGGFAQSANDLEVGGTQTIHQNESGTSEIVTSEEPTKLWRTHFYAARSSDNLARFARLAARTPITTITNSTWQCGGSVANATGHTTPPRLAEPHRGASLDLDRSDETRAVPFKGGHNG